MHKPTVHVRIRALLLLLLWLLITAAPARAQEGYPLPDNLAVITAENAAQVVQLAQIGDTRPILSWVTLFPTAEVGLLRSRGTATSFSLRTGEESIWNSFPSWAVQTSADGSIIMNTIPLPDVPAARVGVWSIDPQEEPQELIDTFTSGWAAAISEDGRYLATTRYIGCCDIQIVLWDVQTSTEIALWTINESTIDSLAFTTDGTLLVTGSDKGVLLWDLASAIEENRDTLTEVARITYLEFPMYINRIQLSGNGETLLISGSRGWDRYMNLVDIEELLSLDEPLSLSTDSPFTIRNEYVGIFSPDSTLLLTQFDEMTLRSVGEYEVRSPLLHLWDVQTQSQLIYLTAERGSFSPDSSVLATSRFNFITLWDVDMLRNGIFQTLNTLTIGDVGTNVRQIAFNPDGTLMFVATDASISVWGVSQ